MDLLNLKQIFTLEEDMLVEITTDPFKSMWTLVTAKNQSINVFMDTFSPFHVRKSIPFNAIDTPSIDITYN